MSKNNIAQEINRLKTILTDQDIVITPIENHDWCGFWDDDRDTHLKISKNNEIIFTIQNRHQTVFTIPFTLKRNIIIIREPNNVFLPIKFGNRGYLQAYKFNKFITNMYNNQQTL